MCICIPNMKFLCLTLCQGEVYTDDDDANDDTNTNDDGQSMIVQGSLVDKPNEPKTPLMNMIWRVSNILFSQSIIPSHISVVTEL